MESLRRPQLPNSLLFHINIEEGTDEPVEGVGLSIANGPPPLGPEKSFQKGAVPCPRVAPRSGRMAERTAGRNPISRTSDSEEWLSSRVER